MSGRPIRLTDEEIERALMLTTRVELADDLANEVASAIRSTPQNRGPVSRLMAHGPGAGQQKPALMFAAAAALLLLAGLLLAVAASRLTPPQLAANGVVVLGSDRVGLTVVDPSTGGTRQLVAPWTTSASGRTDRDDLLALSRPGDRLAYVVSEASTWSIEVIDVASGSSVTRISGTDEGIWPEWGVQWSSDGSHLILGSTVGGLPRVGVVDLAGGSAHPIDPAEGLSFDPAVSPLDGRIVVVATPTRFDPGARLVVTDAVGNNAKDLSIGLLDGVSIQGAPAWSPDGRRLVFTVGSPGGQYALATTSDQGGDARLVSPWLDDWVSALWSPDGTRLLGMVSPQGGRPADVYTNGDQTAELFLVNIDGSGWQRIVDRACANAAWAPDGKAILFERGACEQPRRTADVVTVDTTGSNERILWTGDARASARLSIGWQAVPAPR
jgi:hypothetical protein